MSYETLLYDNAYRNSRLLSYGSDPDKENRAIGLYFPVAKHRFFLAKTEIYAFFVVPPHFNRGMRKIDKDRRVSVIGARQLGVVHRDQLLAAGLTGSDIHRRVSSGNLLRVLPRVYRLSPVPESWEGLLVATLLWAGPEAAITHRAAGKLWRLSGVECEFAEISVPRQQRAPGPWVTVHCSRDLSARVVTKSTHFRMTNATRTVIDLGSVLTREQFEVAAEDALSRRLTSTDQIERMLGNLQRKGRQGVEQVRAFLRDRSAGGAADSRREIKLLKILRAAGLPDPVRQMRVALANGAVVRPDLAYPHERVLIEFDSYQFHSGLRAWGRDRARRNQLTAQGWTVLQATNEDLKHPTSLLSQIRGLLLQKSAEG